MKVAVVTMHVKQGKCEENVSYMKQMIQKAREEQADMIVFPQNAVSGYLLGDQWLDDDWCRYVDSFNEALLAESEDIAIVWGNIRYRNRRRFNAAFLRIASRRICGLSGIRPIWMMRAISRKTRSTAPLNLRDTSLH